MSEFTVLDLFCGLGGFSQAFVESDRWDAVTVDIEERFDPDICADVFDLRPSDFEREFDVVLASPPCTYFSLVRNGHEISFRNGSPINAGARDAVALVYHTLGVINGLSPNYWFLENPQGHLRHVIGRPTSRVTYCQYGAEYMKPTDLWGHHPPMVYKQCSYGDDCHAYNTDQEHGGPGNCEVTDSKTTFQQRTSASAERAKVPYQLSESIRNACEAALDGEVPEQQTLTDVGGESA